MSSPLGLCFLPGHRHIAVADSDNNRVSLFGVDGEFVRHVGVGELSSPQGVTCSADSEIVVADTDNRRVVVFSDVGELLMVVRESSRGGRFTSVSLHGGALYAQHYYGRCVVFV